MTTHLFSPMGDRLDETDRAILAVLCDDASITNEELARRVGLSPSPCRARVRRLETSGVIRGYIPIVDEQMCAPWSTYFVSVTLLPEAHRQRGALDDAILAAPEILEATNAVGHDDLYLKVALKAPADWTSLAARLDPGNVLIGKVRLNPVVRTIKHRTAHPLIGPPPPRIDA